MAGLFVSLEGLDGAGTTTQTREVAAALRGVGHTVVETAEPSDSPVGVLLRGALRGEWMSDEATLALLFAADRLQHIAREVEPALARGAIVISDRYVHSSLAYQSTHLPLDWVSALNARAPRPHLAVLLRIDAELALARRKARPGEDELFDALPRQREVARAYDRVMDPSAPDVCVVDASRPMETVRNEVVAAVQRAWEQRYP